MKSALVLGLAFAANALAAEQGDNELIVYRDAASGIWKSTNTRGIGSGTVHLPNLVKYDEEADDELLVRPRNEVLAQQWKALKESADDEFSALYAFVRDDEADDELLVRPRNEVIAQQWKAMKENAAADDELIIAPTDEFGRPRRLPYIKYDEEGDNELLAYRDPQTGNWRSFRRGDNISIPNSLRNDDEGDNELLAYRDPQTGNWRSFRRGDNISIPNSLRNDDEDNELIVYRDAASGIWKSTNTRGIGSGTVHLPNLVKYDLKNDDELVYLGDLMRSAKTRDQEFVPKKLVKPTIGKFDDEADDELVYLPKIRDQEFEPKKLVKPTIGKGFLSMN